MKIKKATKQYEAWAGERARLVADDLVLKHNRMREAPFPFLRATFYRWAQTWPEVCTDLAQAPVVLAVGDLHVENFGTWRDIDGRLIWGVNDLDEAYSLPYTNDLVRLATSAHFAEHHLAIRPRDAAAEILKGYTAALECGGEPFVLEERHAWLREVATGELRDPVHFWKKMEELPAVKGPIPKGARSGLESLLPEKGLAYRVAHRIAGLGSLGRERYVALADWRGGRIAREAKALFESACVWACREGASKLFYETLLRRAVRAPDPFVHLRGRWIVRRLAPHCSRVELASLPKQRDEAKLLQAMGFETANIHLGSPGAIPAVRHDLKKRSPDWVCDAAKAMAKVVTQDWEDWKNDS